MNGSTTSVIIIEWGESPSNITQSVVYEVQYTLFPLEGGSISGREIVSAIHIEHVHNTVLCLVVCDCFWKFVVRLGCFVNFYS